MNCKFCNKEINNSGALVIHEKKCINIQNIKNEVINLYVNKNYSHRELRQKFKIQSYDLKNILKDKTRTISEATKLEHNKNPRILSKEHKDKLRIARLKFMKEHPEQTAWRLSNLSYPEMLFLNKLIELDWINKYDIQREKSVFPYFIDFAFKKNKIAFEIDGSQHLLPDRAASDKKKDKLLISLNWNVIRVSEKDIKKDLNNVIKKLQQILN